jgi:hypothetical protein
MTWGADDLSKFLDTAHSNRQANCANFPEWYARIVQLDGCFARAGKNLTNPSPVMAGNFFLRCYYAYRTAAGLALAGQTAETFVMLRSVLEWAGYALIIFETPALEEAWVNRHVGDGEMKAQKHAFRNANVDAAIMRRDAKLARIFDELYQRAIDFGGHPNPHGTFMAMKLEGRGDGQTVLTTTALSSDPKALAHALKSTGQVGLTALHVLQFVFKAKFELLGIRLEIETLRNSGGF